MKRMTEENNMNEHEELIRHVKSLFGYMRTGTEKAIQEIGENNTPDAGGEPNEIQRLMLQRADEMAFSLAAIEEALQ